MPRTLAALIILVLTGCKTTSPVQGSSDPVKQYPMRGSVLRLDPQGHIATIKNEKIPGWMEAMTMDFPVKEQADFDRLHPGETIQATVFVQGLEYWVGDVKPGQ